MKILYILNPSSNGGRTKKLEDHLQDRPYPEGTEIAIRHTRAPGDGATIAREEAGNYDVVCSVGGDGTLNEVARGIYEAGKGVLGIIPSGTGNDTMKGLGWSQSVDEAIDRLFTGQAEAIDCGFADEHFFINIASIGFDAKVVEGTESIKKHIKSGAAYSLSLLKTFFSYRSLAYEKRKSGNQVLVPTENGEDRFLQEDSIEAAEWLGNRSGHRPAGKVEDRLFLLAVGNGKFYGGGFQILPQAEFDDGFLDICLISNLSRFRFLLLFPSIFRAKHKKHRKYVHMSRGKSYEIFMKEDFILNIDGEIHYYSGNRSILFHISEKVIKLIR